jgi:DNA-binding NarL/FixJ family response regulator
MGYRERPGISGQTLLELPYGLRHSLLRTCPLRNLSARISSFHVQRNILIVDDSALARRTLRRVIEDQSGWHICGEASNGAEGISAATRLKPDVVVLDLAMPVMNGIDAAIQIKRLMPETRLVMFTSYLTPTTEEVARSVGIEDVVKKGDQLKLLQTLHRFESSR